MKIFAHTQTLCVKHPAKEQEDYIKEITPLLVGEPRKKVHGKLMAPPNSLGQMLNFGTSFKKFEPGPSEKIAFEVIV